MRPVLVAAAAAGEGDDAVDRRDRRCTIVDELRQPSLHRLERDVLVGLRSQPMSRPVSCCGKKPFGTMT